MPKPKAVKSTKDLKRELWRIRRDEGAESIETFVMPLINSFEAGLRRDAKDERIAEVVRNYIKRRVLDEEDR